MKYFIKVKTHAKEEKVEKISGSSLKISVKELPINNSANEEVIEILSKYFKVAKSQINIIKGLKSKNKIIEIKGFVS